MKVPIATAQTCTTAGTGKPLHCTNTALNTAFQVANSTPGSTNSYEPTSVLDLQRSPSPAGKPTEAGPTIATHHHPSAVDLDNLEGWDSILSELGLNDDSNPNPKLWSHSQITPIDSHHHQHHHQHHHLGHLPDFPSSQPFDHIHAPSPLIPPPPSDLNFPDFSFNQNFGPLDFHLHHHNSNSNNNNNNNNNNGSNNNNSYGLDFIEDLIKAAQCLESNDSQQLHLILARLNQRLRSPSGKPLQRAAFYFKEALNHLASPGPAHSPPRPASLSSYEVVQTIRAYKAFSGVSPVSLFSTFAANQAVLEAVDGAPFVHLIDFDLGFGGHWASFMRELVDKSAAAGGGDHGGKVGASAMVLRLTAVVADEFSLESKLVRDNLSQFARDLGINFHIDFVLLDTFDLLSFKSIKFIEGERIAVHLSPSALQRSGRISRFVGDLRAVGASAVVVVDKEVGIETGTASFSVNFIAGIEFYTGLMESLDATAAGGFAGGTDCVRRIESFVLRPRIAAAVEAAAASGKERKAAAAWREAFAAAGMRAVGFSQFADFQAECLLRRAQVGGFHVAKRHGEMLLCWQDRPLVATSAWR